MSSTYISPRLRELVAERADDHCEYCLVRDNHVWLPHQADHIMAKQQGGKTQADNLALACLHCRRYKGPNSASLDPIFGQLTLLFNPRSQRWADHFLLEQAYIQPLTPVGRVTVQLLKLNHPDRVRVRQALIDIGAYP